MMSQEGCSRYAIVGLFDLQQLFFGSLISRCMAINVEFGRVSLPTEWLILGDRTEAADYTKLWNDLRESISLVKGGKETESLQVRVAFPR
jgi:hypothetical protein